MLGFGFFFFFCWIFRRFAFLASTALRFEVAIVRRRTPPTVVVVVLWSRWWLLAFDEKDPFAIAGIVAEPMGCLLDPSPPKRVLAPPVVPKAAAVETGPEETDTDRQH